MLTANENLASVEESEPRSPTAYVEEKKHPTAGAKRRKGKLYVRRRGLRWKERSWDSFDRHECNIVEITGGLLVIVQRSGCSRLEVAGCEYRPGLCFLTASGGSEEEKKYVSSFHVKRLRNEERRTGKGRE